MGDYVKRIARKKLMLLAAILAVLFVVLRLIAWGNCSYYGWQTGRDVRYAAFIGCMVKVQDGWIPRNEIRVVQ
jgi:hypothetical protein